MTGTEDQATAANCPLAAATASSTTPPASISIAAASMAWAGSASRWLRTDPNPQAAAAPSTMMTPGRCPAAAPVPTRTATPASPAARPATDLAVMR